MNERDLTFAPVSELGRLLRAGKVSSVELTRLSLDALEAEGRRLGAVAEVTRSLALRQARRADRELREGNARGPLHGIPYGAKDLLATKGIATRWGSPAHRNQVFDYDATVIERLRKAGAVLVGKLAMIELAGGGGYETAGACLTGACRNPYDPTRWAGGSSSGSGAAVGGGMVGFAIGSETCGSITCPAAFCNVSGLRPTYGRVPRYGAMALSWTLDKIGPMARTARDCGLVLAAIAGRDPRDESSATGRFLFRPQVWANERMRLGVLPVDYRRNRAEAARKRFREALEVFRSLSHSSAPVKLPSLPYGFATWTIIEVEGAAAFESLLRSRQVEKLADERQQAGLLAGLVTPGVDYLRAMRIRAMAGREAAQLFERFDVLVAPTLLHGAPPVSRISEGSGRLGGNAAWGNLLGWPSLSIPMGPDERGLPLGIELIGPPYEEAKLLALGIAFQGETNWHRWRPSQPVGPPRHRPDRVH
ncbi:MAG: amidase [Armatimonadota bacterium]